MDRYRAALRGWVMAGMAAPVVAVIALLAVVDLICTGTGECSWGLELVLVVPILAAAFFVTGPRRVARSSAPWLDAPGRRRAARTTRVGAAASLLVFYVLGSFGLVAFVLAVVIATLGIPALVVWRTAPSGA